MADYTGQLDTAIRAASRAGDMLREEFHRPGGPRGHGGHADMDEIAEQEIHRTLSSAFPDYGYLGEELGAKGGPKDAGNHTWVVDPNDGTSDFLRGFRGASVAIALLRAGSPVLGVVYAYCAPDSAGDLISWAEGCGPVHRNGAAVERSWPVCVTEDSTLLVSTYADFKMELNARVAAPLRFRGTPSIAYRLAMMAVGDADATASLNAPHPWDYAAGHALLIGAGANLADVHGRVVTYSNDGQSDSGGACYGGSEALILHLLDRDWTRARRGPRDPATPFVLPMRGRAVRDPGILSRAQGAFIASLACSGNSQTLEGQPAGESELALELARSIVKSGGYQAGEAARAYRTWYASNPFGINETNSRPLLRVTPIAIAFEPARAWDVALEDAALTHTSNEVRREAAAFAATVSHAIRSGAGAESVYQWALGHGASQALEQLRTASSPADARDPIAGALLGAVYGLRRVPSRSIDRVLTAHPLAGLPGVRQPRPPECWASDALYLVERLLTLTSG